MEEPSTTGSGEEGVMNGTGKAGGGQSGGKGRKGRGGGEEGGEWRWSQLKAWYLDC